MRLALVLILTLLMLQIAEGMEYKESINASQILTNISKGLPVKYDHVIVKGDLNLNNPKGLPTKLVNRSASILFIASLLQQPSIIWNDSASKYIYIVTSPIQITNSVFEGVVYFSNVIFENTTTFYDSNFSSTVDFSYSTFNSINFPESSFRGSKFNGPAYFWYSSFNSSANFDGAVFNSYANFGHSKFNNSADFMNTKFNNLADFWYSSFNGVNTNFDWASFDGAVFNSYANFGHSKFNISAAFSLSTFNRSADFSEAMFNKSADFNYIGFQNAATFSDSEFKGDTSFNSSVFKEDALFEDSIFSATLGLTRTKYDRLFIRYHNIHKLIYNDAAYQLLIDNFDKQGLHKDADDCYYQFRVDQFLHGQSSHVFHETQPLPRTLQFFDAIQNFLLRVGDAIVWTSYGYGKRPIYPITWSIITIFVAGFLWWRGGLTQKGIFEKYSGYQQSSQGWRNEPSNLIGALIFSLKVFLSGTKLFIDTPEIPVMPRWTKSRVNTLFWGERLLGAFFSVLFFLALAATIMR